jgi:transcriptional regulator with XRE-family HTH domain
MNMNGYQDKTSFAQRIDLLIDEVGSMAALARIAGLSETTIRNWKNGKTDAMRENLIELMKGAGVELRWLVLGEGPMRHDNTIIIPGHA